MDIHSILISRVDNIGDVILTLPVCGLIKEVKPSIKIFFLCKELTLPIVKESVHVDEAIIWDFNSVQFPKVDVIIHVYPHKKIAQIAKISGITIQIGTNRRWFHWLYCNQLISLSRKNSKKHEAELNIELLKPLGILPKYSRNQLWKYYGWMPLKNKRRRKFHLILHLKSRGSAKEWSSKNYLTLAMLLPPKGFQIYITGTKEEGSLIKEETPELTQLSHVSDKTGQFDLKGLIDFIGSSDGLVAASTGPLHIAAASGIFCLGLFSNQKPIHSDRWSPIGKKAQTLSEHGFYEEADLLIKPNEVFKIIENWRGY